MDANARGQRGRTSHEGVVAAMASSLRRRHRGLQISGSPSAAWSPDALEMLPGAAAYAPRSGPRGGRQSRLEHSCPAGNRG
jgi:hypothetical protein